ncbi:MAG TPA: glycosyltransferase family 39 protein, partial [Telluria sp.]|nr:glycosyltransferase family 39 protein [Telluria sp.]
MTSYWRNWKVGIPAAALLMLALLTQRHAGLNPAVFADEWFYSKMARLMDLKDAIVPSYLYLWIFRASNACGTGFLDCVRFGNAVFFVSAAPFVFLTARAFTTARVAGLVAVLSLLAPLHLYTAFFMPEALYYFLFCVLGWVALTREQWSATRKALAGGVLLGVMSLVKVHALFLLPALCLFLLFDSAGANGGWLRRGLPALLLAAVLMLGVKFGVGYLFGGKAALTLFGNFYGAGASAASQRPLMEFVTPALVNLRGHLMAMAVLLPLPLAMLVHALASGGWRERPYNRLYVYTLLMLGAALGMTVLYTASIARPDNNEALRLHVRYYSFVFPLLFMVAAVPLRNG